jgi:hypothetical protein
MGRIRSLLSTISILIVLIKVLFVPMKVILVPMKGLIGTIKGLFVPSMSLFVPMKGIIVRIKSVFGTIKTLFVPIRSFVGTTTIPAALLFFILSESKSANAIQHKIFNGQRTDITLCDRIWLTEYRLCPPFNYASHADYRHSAGVPHHIIYLLGF